MTARSSRRRGVSLLGAMALVIAAVSPAPAAPGDLDPTFDTDGKVTTDFADSLDQVRAVAIQPDGKMVAAGSARFWGTPDVVDFALARYNTDGSLDTTFGNGGVSLLKNNATGISGRPAATKWEIYGSLTLDSRGRYVMPVYSKNPLGGSYAGIARYLPNGTQDF